jgi:DMSO/TMAO reductase YedYZ molybdopterin-dependent catalytic subunit
MKKGMMFLAFVVMSMLVVAISGCTQTTTTPTPTAAPTAAPTGPTVLTVKGNVTHPLELTMDDLKKYESMTVETLGKDNATVKYTGISYNKLLDDAAPASNAASVLMIGSDGYNKSIEIAGIRSTADAIIAINADNTLKAVIPGQSKGAWVGNLTTIEIQ